MKTLRWIIALCAVVSAWATVDSANNFAKVTVSTGYTSGATAIVLSAGGGALLPTAPFNLVWWNSTDYTDPSDDPSKEIVRVTAVSTDTLTVTRAQEGTSAAAHNTGGKTYKMIGGPTAIMVTQINNDIAFKVAGTAGTANYLSLGGVTTNNSPIEVRTVPLSGASISLSFTNGPSFTHTQAADTTISFTETSSVTNRYLELHATTDGTHVYNVPVGVYAQTQTNQPFAAGFYTLTFWIINGRTNYYVSPALIGDSDVKAGAAIARSKIAAGSANHIVIDDGSGNLSSEAQLGAARFPPLTGAITTPGGSLATTLADNAVVTANITDANVTLPKLATQADGTLVGNNSGSTASPTALTILPKAIAIVSGAAATSNTNKITNRKYLLLDVDRVSGTSATMSTSDTTAQGFGNVSFVGNTATTNSNFIEFSCIVPKWLDTGSDLIVEALRFKTTGTQTTAVNFDIGMADVADSAAADPTSFSNWIAMGSGTLTSPAAGDQFTIKNKTLTSWKSGVTALDGLKIRMDRNDSNTDAIELKQILISYVESQ